MLIVNEQSDVYVEKPLEYKIRCPVCEKRVLDVSELPLRAIRVRFKCPHCRKLVEKLISAVS